MLMGNDAHSKTDSNIDEFTPDAYLNMIKKVEESLDGLDQELKNGSVDEKTTFNRIYGIFKKQQVKIEKKESFFRKKISKFLGDSENDDGFKTEFIDKIKDNISKMNILFNEFKNNEGDMNSTPKKISREIKSFLYNSHKAGARKDVLFLSYLAVAEIHGFNVDFKKSIRTADFGFRKDDTKESITSKIEAIVDISASFKGFNVNEKINKEKNKAEDPFMGSDGESLKNGANIDLDCNYDDAIKTLKEAVMTTNSNPNPSKFFKKRVEKTAEKIRGGNPKM